MKTTQSTNRDLALTFYRRNLHGLGWKVECGNFAAAVETIDGYIRDMVKAKDFAFANELRGMKSTIKGLQKMQNAA